jgi:L-threonylcarbamoyladenylate synthase
VKTRIVSAHTPGECVQAVATAAKLLREGEAVALPTETVYGLAADALNPFAVAKIFEAKERPRFDPLIVHLPERDWLKRVALLEDESRPLVEGLIGKFWPGPLSLVLPRKEIVPDLVTAGLETVAVRWSAHPLFTEIIRNFGGPLAAPSANRFGCLSPTAAEHVHDELEDRIPLIIDGGPTMHGIESTIIAIRRGRMELLRRGPITSEQLVEFGEVVTASPDAPRKAPGQLPTHYAPHTPLVLVKTAAAFVRPRNKNCGLLAWNPSARRENFSETRFLSSNRDLPEAAANLFRCLRELDHAKLDLIVAEEVPDEGLGKAINDRLRRAAQK